MVGDGHEMAADLLDSAIVDGPTRENDTPSFTEFDLALIDALQTRPRMPWSGLGAVLGVSASTVARRWERLTSRGLAWLTAYTPFGTTQVGYLQISGWAGCSTTEVLPSASSR